eukprot:c41490_g1_i1 orf=156-356(+)
MHLHVSLIHVLFFAFSQKESNYLLWILLILLVLLLRCPLLPSRLSHPQILHLCDVEHIALANSLDL